MYAHNHDHSALQQIKQVQNNDLCIHDQHSSRPAFFCNSTCTQLGAIPFTQHVGHNGFRLPIINLIAVFQNQPRTTPVCTTIEWEAKYKRAKASSLNHLILW